MKLLLSIAGSVALMTLIAEADGAAALSLAAGDPAAGRAFALQVCASCHVVAEDQSAPRSRKAPGFAAIANTRAMTSNALHAFLATPHPTMPNLILTPEQTDDVVAYILSLKRPSRATTTPGG
jgi:mono/diheme cytochrome c family protein